MNVLLLSDVDACGICAKPMGIPTAVEATERNSTYAAQIFKAHTMVLNAAVVNLTTKATAVGKGLLRRSRRVACRGRCVCV